MDLDDFCVKVEVVLKRNQFSSYAAMDLDGAKLEAMMHAVETGGGPAVTVMQMDEFPSRSNREDAFKCVD